MSASPAPDFTQAEREKVMEVLRKLAGDLQRIGLDPWIHVDRGLVGIIIPVEQLVERVRQGIPPRVFKALDVSIEERAVGMKGYIVIKIRKKQQQ
ncbi:MAG: hypothetical protein LM577_07100 [Thermoproteaceae archaeon]|nr:hypothetical protein [Thermoproteaceae archaeon]